MDSKIDSGQLLNQALTQTPKVTNNKLQEGQKLKESTQQFEAIFIQQMFKEMRQTVPEEGLIQRGNADDVYTQMQDMEAAKIMANQGGIGLAELMMQQLQKDPAE